MLFKEFGKAQSMADGFEWSIACCKAGIPSLLIAPPSGGKSTIIFALEKYLRDHGEASLRVSRIGLRGLHVLAKFLDGNQRASLLNEDYATIGSSEYMVEKLGELVGALSYSGTYQDQGFGIDLQMVRLGFISGIQPLWVKTMMTHTVFSTHIREKFLRYYFLPHCVSEDIDDMEASQILNKNIKAVKNKHVLPIPKEFIEALSFQVGLTRAKIYAPRLAEQLSQFFRAVDLPRALKYFAIRLGFEKAFVHREIKTTGFEVETNWASYHVLYWALRRGRITGAEYMARLGVTSMRSVERCLSDAMRLGWITSTWNSQKKVYVPNYNILRGDFSK